jgi:hypothetical protein
MEVDKSNFIPSLSLTRSPGLQTFQTKFGNELTGSYFSDRLQLTVKQMINRRSWWFLYIECSLA